MIRIGSIEKMDEYPGEKWMIVRSPKEIPADVKHVPVLSPSPELFQVYKEARKKGIWDEDFFQRVYVPWFIANLRVNQEALDLLEYLCRESKKRDFFLGCYCKEEKQCHRVLIAILLQIEGATIEDFDYTKYGRLFEKIKNEFGL